MRRILLVIDMQNDFISGSLGTGEARSIVERVAAEIRKYPREDILATRDTHPADYLQTQEGKNLPVPHCILDTWGWQLQETIAQALRGAEIVDKPTFGSVVLAQKLTEMAAQEPLDITLVGLCTDICVISNALLVKAYLPETPVHVLAQCCAGVTPQSHEQALAVMRMCQVDVQD